MILIIDNYDSFVHTLARYVSELGLRYQLIRNDRIDPKAVLAQQPEAVILSPGPATPSQAGICVDLIRQCRGHIPMLGICLGHQAIGEAYGGTVARAPSPAHGISAQIQHNGHALFANLENPFSAARYHSLAVTQVPAGLRQIAHINEGVNMAVADDAAKIYGMQFHPESILTQNGHQLLSNFFTLAGIKHKKSMPYKEIA